MTDITTVTAIATLIDADGVPAGFFEASTPVYTTSLGSIPKVREMIRAELTARVYRDIESGMSVASLDIQEETIGATDPRHPNFVSPRI